MAGQNKKKPCILNKHSTVQEHRKVNGASYSDVVRGRPRIKVWKKKGEKVEVDAVYLFQDRIIGEGLFTFTIMPMSGDMVLIKPANGEVFEEFMKEYEDLMETWFYDVRQWSSALVVKERGAWLRCQGVPLHAWSDNFFEMIAISFGTFVSMDWSSMQKKRLDVARMLIRTSSWEVVNRLIKVQVNGLFYNIRVIEEPFPEFTFNDRKSGNKEGPSSSSDSLSNFSWGAVLEDLIDTEEEEDTQRLFEDDGINEEELIRQNKEANEATIEILSNQVRGRSGGGYN